MTNAEIDQVVSRIERRALVRSLLRVRINVLALVAFGALASLAFVMEETVTALLLAILAMSVVVLTIGAGVQNHLGQRRAKFWDFVRTRGFAGEPPTGDTRLLIDKIVQIQTAPSVSELLPMRQAVKLVEAYERQSRQLEAVRARLSQLRATRETLGAKISQLQQLGENHSAGSQTLQEACARHNALQKVAREIQGSCGRLEVITNKVWKTAQARQLHRELDQLSASNASAVEPAFEAESLEEIERQIGCEIEIYRQLERETDEQLR